MYDWNALWHKHEGYRTGYASAQDDINEMASDLNAKRIRSAHDRQDIAVYETDDLFVLVGHQNGLQILNLPKHTLHDIDVRFVTKDEGADISLPYLEVRVTNRATRDDAVWRETVRRDEASRTWIGKRLLSEGIMPAMPFDDLSFTDQSLFRDALYQAWQQGLERLSPQINAWVPHADLDKQSLARYAAILKHEQAVLARQFSAEERAAIAAALSGQSFAEPAACRGVWLKVEARLMESECPVNADALLEKLQKLTYSQEVALIESLH
jgi:hypothetical protein